MKQAIDGRKRLITRKNHKNNWQKKKTIKAEKRTTTAEFEEQN